MQRVRGHGLGVVAYAVAGVVALAAAPGGCRCGDRVAGPDYDADADDPAVTDVAPVVREPSTATVTSRHKVVYPERVPLGGDAPAIRPFVAVAVPTGEPGEATERPRRVAVSGWKAGTTDPLLQLIDLETARVVWSVSGSCRGAVQSATNEHLVCASGNGIDGIDLRTGQRLWASQLEHVASGQGVVAARDARGVSLLEARSGSLIVRLRGPAAFASRVRRVCRDPVDESIALIGWSDGGSVAVYDVDAKTGGVARRWQQRLPGGVLDDRVCRRDALSFLVRKDGRRLWLELSAEDGSLLSEAPAGADARGYDLGPDGFVALGTGHGGSALLGAPVQARQVFLRGSHLLAVGRAEGASAGGRVALFRVPTVGAGTGALAPPRPLEVEPKPVADAMSFSHVATLPDSDGFVPASATLVGSRLWIVGSGGSRGSGGSGGRGTEVVSFDLDRRAFGARDAELCTARARPVAVVAVGDSYACGTRENAPGRGFVRGRAEAGATPWTRRLSTLDDLRVAGGYYVAVAGATAVVLHPDTGEASYRAAADNAFAPRFAGLGDLIVHVEPGRLVARDPARGGEPVWNVAFEGYPVALAEVGDRVVAVFRDGAVASLAADGAVIPSDAPAGGPVLGAAGDLWFESPEAAEPAGARVFALRGRAPDGSVVFETGFALRPEGATLGQRGSDPSAPVVVEDREGVEQILVLAPDSGRVLGAVSLPAARKQGTAFATQRVVGALSSRPLAVHTVSVPTPAATDPDGT